MMMRIKHQRVPSTVQLHLYGPKTLLSGTRVAKAVLSQTWYEFLNGAGGLQVSPTSGLFVCTLNYTPTTPKEGQGWRAELNDKIEGFVSKFERKRKQFSVRICHTGSDNSTENNNSLLRITAEPLEYMSESCSSTRVKSHSNFSNNIAATTSSQGPSIVIPLGRSSAFNRNQLSSSTGQKRKFDNLLERIRKNEKAKDQMKTSIGVRQGKLQKTSSSSQKQLQQQSCRDEVEQNTLSEIDAPTVLPFIKEEPLVEIEWSSDDDADQLQLGAENDSYEQQQVEKKRATTYGDNMEKDELYYSGLSDADSDLDNDDDHIRLELLNENDQLRREGVDVKNIKALVQERISHLDSDLFLNVGNEIQRLKKNKQWDRNTTLAPLSSFLLQYVFAK